MRQDESLRESQRSEPLRTLAVGAIFTGHAMKDMRAYHSGVGYWSMRVRETKRRLFVFVEFASRKFAGAGKYWNNDSSIPKGFLMPCEE